MSQLVPPHTFPYTPGLPIREVSASFRPEPLHYDPGLKSTTTRRHNQGTVASVASIPAQLAQFIFDSGFNDRLGANFDACLASSVVAPSSLIQDMSYLMSGSGLRNRPEIRMQVFNKEQLFVANRPRLLYYANLIMTSGIVDEKYHGIWVPCKPPKGAADWVFVAEDGTIIAWLELKLWTVLTKAIVEEFIRQVSKPGGLRVSVVVEGQTSKLWVTDETGTVDRNWHLAEIASQLWDESRKYPKASVFLLTSYEHFIPFERDPSARQSCRHPDTKRTVPTATGGSLFSDASANAATSRATSGMAASRGISSNNPPANTATHPTASSMAASRSLYVDPKHPKTRSGSGINESGDPWGKVMVQGKEVSSAALQKWQGDWKAIMDNALNLSGISLSSSVWARFHFDGDSSVCDSVQHYFTTDFLADSAIYGWVDKSLASVLLEVLDDTTPRSALAMVDRPPSPPHSPSLSPPAKVPTMHSLSDAPTIDLALSIGSLVDSGHLSDAYAVTPGTSIPRPHDFPSLVVKTMIPYTFDDVQDYERDFTSGDKALQAWENETQLYAGALSGLQGKIVPGCFGAPQGFTLVSRGLGPFPIYFLLLEKLGDAVCGRGERLRSLPFET
ncbi:hypothetical protein IAR50_000046 [Cryptococcus sp. DSM 104548]